MSKKNEPGKGRDKVVLFEDFFTSMLNSVTESAFLITQDGIVLAANETVAKRLGFSSGGDLVGRNMYDLLPPEVAESRRSKVQEVVLTGEPVQFEDVRSGRWIHNSIYPVYDSTGGVSRLSVFAIDITRQKAQEERLSLLGEMVDSAPASITIHDTGGNFIYVNRETLRLHGYTEEEFMSLNLKDLDVPESVELLEERFRMIAEKGEMSFESAHFHKDGSVIPVLVMAKNLDWKGTPAVMSIATDIRESKKAEQALRENEELIMAVMDNLPLGVAVNSLDPAVEFSYMNDRFWKTYKTSREELSGPDAFWSAVYKDPEFREKIRERVLKDCESGDPGKMQWDDVPVTREGETFFVSARNTPVPGSSLMVSAVWDVTEYKKTEDQLRRASERLQAIYDHSPLLISEFDLEGRYLLVNRAISELFGLSPRELEGRTFSELLPEEVSEIFMRRTRHVWDSQKPLAAEDTVDIGGVKRHFLTMLFPLYEKDGHINSIGSIAHDITDRKEAEDSLRDALGRLRRVTGSVIQVIVMAVESRDPYTAGHQRRVGDLARAIATEMGLTDHDVEGIRIAGVIHDLGKISVPSEILSKPRILNDTEFAIVKEHPQKGYDILKDVDFDWPVAEMVLQHHERLDGSGYPRGLKDGEILLQARILAVADVVEAMASHRPYRPTLGLEAALDEITLNKGKLYDPEAVDACLRLFREKHYRLVGV
ncbi:MAG TPA: PAS domain S-box protein [Synergistales bacterium]|nr:PAS domain S-box protein [Synergistales bacterium]